MKKLVAQRPPSPALFDVTSSATRFSISLVRRVIRTVGLVISKKTYFFFSSDAFTAFSAHINSSSGSSKRRSGI